MGTVLFLLKRRLSEEQVINGSDYDPNENQEAADVNIEF